MHVQAKKDVRELELFCTGLVVDDSYVAFSVLLHYVNAVNAAHHSDFLTCGQGDRVGGDVRADFQLAVADVKIGLGKLVYDMPEQDRDVFLYHLKSV